VRPIVLAKDEMAKKGHSRAYEGHMIISYVRDSITIIEKEVKFMDNLIGNGLSRRERETIIRIAEDEDVWEVYTSSPVSFRKLSKIADALGIEPVLLQGGARFKLPKACVSLRKPINLSDEARSRLAERMRKNNLKNAG
jgi:hypothetical protein